MEFLSKVQVPLKNSGLSVTTDVEGRYRFDGASTPPEDFVAELVKGFGRLGQSP